ncbi:MAG: S41 family peptidase [Prevotella sp.]|nr:S41 family peptidase [Prevotella sp.]MDD7045508.1 S41 family peptidase [Prevotella sp.]MDY5547448.1 S41 family peptidase [Prevotella sp.]
MYKRKIIWAMLVLLSLPSMAQTKKDHNFEVAKNLEVFNSIYRNLDMLYVDSLDPNIVIGNGINYMLRTLDPYTEYYPQEKNEEFKQLLTGKYAGIGAIIKYNLALKNVVIDQPYVNMPAADAGLKKGDVILAIDDTTMVGKSVEYVRNHLRGEPGSTFVLKYKRPATGKVQKVKVVRKQIQMPSVPYYGLVDKGVGYINLVQFTEGCAKEVRRAVIDLKHQGMKGLVFDLRGNGGGSEAEAVQIVNLFVPKGRLVVSNRGKLERANHDYKTTVEPLDTVMPMVVLVDDNTASASEITSGALQDFDRAVVMGTRTYGKGLVQMTMQLPYNGTMKLTTNKYYIPSGRCIQAIKYGHGTGAYQEHISDSLTKVFYTLHGREVRDGGGIKPDVEVKPDSLPNIVFYLASSGRDSTEVLYNYELEYIKNHPNVAGPETFELTDSDYEDFKQMVVKSGFTYDRESEKYMKDLEKIIKFEGYYDDVKTDLDNLKKKLNHNISKDLDIHKSLIKQVIANDLMAAYYFQAGAIRCNLRYDKQWKEAVKLLSDKDRYDSILKGKNEKERK